DNVGMAFVAQKLGAEALYDYLAKFGIGRKTEVDLQGEIAGSLRKKGTWNEVDLVTAGFGQGVAVTAMQMVKSVAAIANGGYEVTPQVVDKLVGPGWGEDLPAKIGSKILSDTTVSEITAMMVEAAEHGESKWTSVKGFKVAGKTGTAQIPIAGHYDEEKTNASFIGFAPANNPKFVMLVTLREPQTSPWASETAAPVWYNIAQDLFLRFGIQPEN
ncbi:penicillin-binding protein, partial [Candidatus Woesebacteria bacterium]|nr:penicillin-binding protein [Candidatus Woesebacteria bacterium]